MTFIPVFGTKKFQYSRDVLFTVLSVHCKVETECDREIQNLHLWNKAAVAYLDRTTSSDT